MPLSFRLPALTAVAVSTLLTMAPGCSSDSDTEPSSAADGGGKSEADGGTSSGNDASLCSCDVTYNDVDKVLTCGQASCIDGERFSCSASAVATDQGACTEEADASTSADAAADASGKDAAPTPTCGAVGADCSFDGTCCSGTYCASGSEVCVVNLGSACTSSSQCEPAYAPRDPGASCTDSVCCGNASYPCAAEGADPSCCSGACGAPFNGISVCQ